MVKITRDAELDLEEDVSISYVEKNNPQCKRSYD